jgi:NADPH-dependent glutamate synthase beta subunit-like oxidoreductase
MQNSGFPKAGKSTRRADPEFKHKLRGSYHADTLKYCYQCGKCSAACPISRFINIYRPNKIIELAKLGLRDMPQSNAFLFCSACSQCTKGCPQRVKVHEFMQGLKEIAADDPDVRQFMSSDFEGVLEALGNEMPFPVTYTWICLQPPEGGFGEYPFGDVIQKAFEHVLHRQRPQIGPAGAEAKKVAVVGSGPAGLTAAWELARNGFAVTVYESQQVLGGMLRTGIPSYRLPNDIVDTEIDAIKACGVHMEIGAPVGPGFFSDLVNSGRFDAVFIAVGALASRKLRVEGESLKGVVPALSILNEYNTNGTAKVGRSVVVIGGGNVATDAAGVAKRCGAETVRLFCLEDRENMPAHEWEIQDIIAEGVEIYPSQGPKTILGDGKCVTGVEFVRCESVFDAEGRFNPVFDEKNVQTVEADMVITAIGQAPDLSFQGGDVGVFRGVVQIDQYTMETTLPGVFAGGDIASGTGSLIEAITDGKEAAASIIRYLKCAAPTTQQA